jgi:predicted dehydrogenase
MLRYPRLLILIAFFFGANLFCSKPTHTPLNFAIVGLGGRAQWLLIECLKLNPAIQVVAICDDNAHECIEYHLNRLASQNDPMLSTYQNALAHAKLYANTPEDLQKLLAEHKNLDNIFITSANYDHLRHINTVLRCSAHKNIFMEKPLFKTLDEFIGFDFNQITDKTIAIGLTLRYSSMAHIVAQQLQAHQQRLGALKTVKVWEHLNFRHAFTAFIMGWRRYINLSGGLLLEKCIHDLDLSLFFINSLGIEPTQISITTQTAHKFFIKSRKDEILNYIIHNENFCKKAEQSTNRSWEPFNFKRDKKGVIDWQTSLDSIFAEYPDNNDFTNRNIIPDYHKLLAHLKTRAGCSIDLEVEVDMGGFKSETARGQLFTFEHGQVLVDIMASKLLINYDKATVHEYDLKTNNSDHADGDLYIAHTIVGNSLPQEYNIATINDPLVILANFMGLISEDQVIKGIKETFLQKENQKWSIVKTA